MGYIFNFSTRKFDYYVTVPTTPTNTVFFDTEDPNDIATVFDPNTPEAADTLYVSQDVDTAGATWVWNSGTNTYDTEIITVPASTPFYIAGTTIDAGSNKTSPIERRGLILATSFNTKRGLTYTGVSDNNKWRRVFAYVLTTNYVGDSFQLLMNEYNTSNGAGKSIKLDVLIKRQDPSVHVSVNIESGLANFDLTNFAVQYDSTNKRINFYYKTLTTYTYTNWTVLNARASNTSEIVWYNSLLGATLVGQPDDAFTSKTISLNKVNGVYTLPAAKATVAGQVLADPLADGTLSWTTPVSGGIIWINNVITGIPTYYATLELASTAAVSGQTINVGPGTYTVTTTATNGLAKDGVNWYFEAGAIVNKATAGSMFALAGFTSGGSVFGQGSFYKTTTAGKIFNMGDLTTGIADSLVDATFEFNICSSTIDVCIINHSAKIITLKGIYCISTGSAAMWLGWGSAGGALVNVGSVRSTASTAIRTWGGASCPYIINAVSVVSTAGDGVHGTGGTYNIGYCSGSSNGYNLGYYGGHATITGNSNSIVFYSLGLLLNGRTELLTVSSGTVTGGFVTNLTVSGGSVNTTVGDYYPNVFISGGVSTITLKGGGFNLNLTGGVLNFLSNHSGTTGFVPNAVSAVSAGRLNILCPLYFADGQQGITLSGTGVIYLSSSGSINTTGVSRTLKNAGIRYQGGKIISNGGTFTVAEANCLPIAVETSNRDIKILSAGLNTNSLLDFLSAKKQKTKFTITAVASTSITLNAITVSESDTATYNTKPLLASRITSLINASALNTVVIATYTASNDFFEVEALVAGTAFTNPAFTNITALFVIENSYALNNITTGIITQDADVE